MISDLQHQISQSLFNSQVQDLGIVGQGIYLVEIDKFRLLREVCGESLEQRCFTKSERAQAISKISYVHFLAGCWAAKEAVIKAIERPRIPENSWLEINISQTTGETSVLLTGRVKTIARQLDIKQWLLSISQTSSYAIASAIALGG